MNLSKISFKTAAFILPALVLSSCSSEETTPSVSPVELVSMTIGAESPQTGTRAVLKQGVRSTDGVYAADAIIWDTNDDISINFHGTSNVVQKFDITGVDPDGLAALNGNGPAGGFFNVYAIYPESVASWVNGAGTPGSTNFTIDHTQNQSGIALSVGENALMWSKTPSTVSFPTGDLSLSFDHKTALLRFNIMNFLDKNITIKSVSFEYDGPGTGNLNTKMTMNNSTGALSGFSTPSVYSVSISGSSTVSKNGLFDAYMLILPTTSVTGGSYIATVTYDIAGGATGVTSSTTIACNSLVGNGEFPAGSRYVFELDIIDESDIFTPTGALTLGMQSGAVVLNGTSYLVISVPAPGGGRTFLSTEFAEPNGTIASVDVKWDGSYSYFSYEGSRNACEYPWRLPMHDDFAIITDNAAKVGAQLLDPYNVSRKWFYPSLSDQQVNRIWTGDDLFDAGETAPLIIGSTQVNTSLFSRDGGFYVVDLYMPVRCVLTVN